MITLGWLKDTHQPPHESSGYDGPQEQITQDIEAMFNEFGVDRWVHTGDPSHPIGDHRGRVPHMGEGVYSAFWDYVEQSGHYDDLLGILPGNHDVPLQNFLESDNKTVLNQAVHFDTGVSVLMINSVGGGTHTGSPSHADEPGGYGVDYGYVPEYVLDWLDEQLDHAADNLKLVFPHHHLQFQSDSAVEHVHSPDDTLREENMYWVVLNHRRVHDRLARHDKVVVPQSHVFQFDWEGVRNKDGVRYLTSKHYYDLVNDEKRGTWGVIEAANEHVRVVTVDPEGAENTLLDVAYD